MRTLIILTLVISFALCAPIANAQGISSQTPSAANAQDDDSKKITVTLTVGDLKAMRKGIADAAYFKAQAEIYKESADVEKQQSGAWKALYESEKNRADNVQGGRIKQLEGELAEKTKQIVLYEEAKKSDHQEIARLTFENSKLRSSRWKIAGITFVFGAATTALVKK